MKKVQSNRYNTATSVLHYLRENADLYAGNASMVTVVGLLEAKMAELQTQIAIQEDYTDWWTTEKRKIRKDLENQAFVLSSAACVYARVTGNTLFYKHCHYTKSDLLHLKDQSFSVECMMLLGHITDHAAELLPFNITPEMIAEFELTMNKFSDIVDKPLDAIADRAQATAKIQLLTAEIMYFIGDMLDKAVVSMIATQPEFVLHYKNFRRIKKVAHRKRALTVVVKDSETGQPLAQAALQIDKTILRTTGPKGMSYVAHLPKGYHKLGVSQPGYQVQSLKFSVTARAATKVEVLLQKTIVESADCLIGDSVNCLIGESQMEAVAEQNVESVNCLIVDSETEAVVENKKKFGFYFQPPLKN